MKKIKIYIDTSVWNFIYADDAPEKQEVTKMFFENIDDFDIFISNIVIEEIEQADVQKRKKLENLLSKYKPKVLVIDDEIKRLAGIYIEKGIIPEKKLDDALHIAYSTFYEMDVLLSWNYRHLSNIFKKKRIMIVNLEEGYVKPLDLTTPMEVLKDDED